MKLVRISMENFMPYKGRSSLTFPTGDQQNVLIVFGDNMRGKTSLLNAIRWGFYGKAVGRHLRELPLHELHNKEAARENDWSMEVRIEFEADGHAYNLLRRAVKKPIVAKPSRPEDFAVEVLLQKDNIAVLGHQVEPEINRFVPEQVSRFFLFDGELLQEYEELLIEGSEQGKGIKSAIEQVLGVPTLINGRSDVGTVLRAAQKQQSRDLAHVAGLEGQAQRQAETQSKLDSLEADLERLNESIRARKLERAGLEDELDKVDAVHKAKIQLDQINDRRKSIVAEQERLTVARLGFMRDAWRDLLRPKLMLHREHLSNQRDQTTQAMAERAKLEGQAANIRRLLDTAACPTCHQGLDVAQREKYGQALGELEVAIRGIEADQDQLLTATSHVKFVDKLLATSVATQVADVRKTSRQRDIEMTRLENDADRLESEIRGYDTAEIARKRQLRDGLMREEGALARDIDLVQKDIDNTKNQLAVLARTLQNMPLARASASTTLVELATSIERIFAESVDTLREKLRMHVQEKASEAFKSLTTQKSYSGLEINENFGLKILDDRGAPVTIRSAGAEQVVALSLIDGLARTGRSAGPVVMDTPFGRLDLKHRDNILRYLPTTTSQLILLVHGGEIRRPRDLDPIASRIGAAYEIVEVNARHSKLERAVL
ncbi:AAA family ATPase [Luteimonas sp. MJ246]|uniref:AAA family ATPase n=1 Tax=Luteimonas sp. MJ174 TaxID=3129237 RepID=UPI0031BABD89